MADQHYSAKRAYRRNLAALAPHHIVELEMAAHCAGCGKFQVLMVSRIINCLFRTGTSPKMSVHAPFIPHMACCKT
jgi:hypothetical protein